MTVEDIKKYAMEKRMPKRGLDDMVRWLNAEYPDGAVDDIVGHTLLSNIDRSAGYWESVRHFLDWSRKEREARRNRKDK